MRNGSEASDAETQTSAGHPLSNPTASSVRRHIHRPRCFDSSKHAAHVAPYSFLRLTYIVRSAVQALPSNALEGLRGDRKGQYSIRINMQWRICFDWLARQSGPSNVEIVDCH
jgi:plasmid maintenance system killer protein